jgi:hypothetical protein
MPDTPKERFIELLNNDAREFEKMADNLEALMPHLLGEDQKKWAVAEIANRQARARELRLLIDKVRND